MPTDDQIRDLAAAAWEVLVEFGRDGHTASQTAKAALRIAYEPFQALYDPEGLAPPPMSLAAAKAHIADLLAREEGRFPENPPLATLHVAERETGRYDVCAPGRAPLASDFTSIEAAQAYIALTYGIDPAAVKARVPTRMARVADRV